MLIFHLLLPSSKLLPAVKRLHTLVGHLTVPAGSTLTSAVQSSLRRKDKRHPQHPQDAFRRSNCFPKLLLHPSLIPSASWTAGLSECFLLFPLQWWWWQAAVSTVTGPCGFILAFRGPMLDCIPALLGRPIKWQRCPISRFVHTYAHAMRGVQ
jgi:hypothetical protein